MPTDGQSIKLKGAFQNSRRRILSILEDAVLLTEIEVNREQFRFVPLSLNAAIERATEKVADLARSHDVSFSPSPMSSSVVLGNEELLTKAFGALFEAAIRFSARGECVLLSHEAERDTVNVVIETRGEPLPEATLEKLFDLLAVGEASMGGINLGLGLAAAKRIISLFGGSASAANRDSGGIRLTATLKLAEGG
jgi:signal transduction histidine kinase